MSASMVQILNVPSGIVFDYHCGVIDGCYDGRVCLSERAPLTQRTEKVAEAVARQILQSIHRTGLAPGAMLIGEGAMVEQFGVGRGSVREALRILEVNGLVRLKPGPGGGPVITEFDPGNFGRMITLHLQPLGATYRQLLEARAEHETVLARKAAEQPGDSPGKLVRAAMDGAMEAVTADRPYAAATGGFHRAVGSASGNPVLALAADSIYAIWSIRVTEVLYPPEERAHVIDQHEAIAQAIEGHDARQAESLMRDHMRQYQDYCEARYAGRMDDLVDWR